MPKRPIAALVAIVWLLAGCAPRSGTVGDAGFVSGDGTTQVIAADNRGATVDLKGETLEGTALDIAQWRGDVVVVNLWASWCAPCRAEAATLANVKRALAAEDVHFLGLNTRDGLVAAQAFSRRFPTDYPSIQDQQGVLTLAFGQIGPAATPTTFVLDRKGRVAARILGVVTEAQLREVTMSVVEEVE